MPNTRARNVHKALSLIESDVQAYYAGTQDLQLTALAVACRALDIAWVRSEEAAQAELLTARDTVVRQILHRTRELQHDGGGR